jgi:alpha-beta hydrolase superfamily lysophospholipase
VSANYDVLDRPEVSASIFHPRAELGSKPSNAAVSDHLISVDTDIQVGARFHCTSPSGANVLFFHGNGEIVADYDELGPVFGRSGINFLVADYRGYGRSNGHPSVSTMLSDSHRILAYVQKWLKRKNYDGPLIVMGRSLGSASALELVAENGNTIHGLIIESGFAYAAPLLRLLGVDADTLGFKEEDGFVNIEKIGTYKGPTLIMHAEYDHIIPYTDGLALYKVSPAQYKKLLKIEGANHNDIMLRGFDNYMQAIQQLVAHIIDGYGQKHQRTIP